eukprot:TRINITY_DN101384_c0_g1_i1.p1 TRINITY_DN101384_c0_g1~~TRINITY_DN101384_c0_g1_i1.p1  ORF type:complete len:995 (+),score=140.26 TRINITY_DN101384_c0_g1_i1:73-3057(+)
MSRRPLLNIFASGQAVLPPGVIDIQSAGASCMQGAGSVANLGAVRSAIDDNPATSLHKLSSEAPPAKRHRQLLMDTSVTTAPQQQLTLIKKPLQPEASVALPSRRLASSSYVKNHKESDTELAQGSVSFQNSSRSQLDESGHRLHVDEAAKHVSHGTNASVEGQSGGLDFDLGNVHEQGKVDTAPRDNHGSQPNLQPKRKTNLLSVATDAMTVAKAQGSSASGHADACYKVAFTREYHKKKRKFENGVLLVRAGKASLHNEDGKHLLLGSTLRISEGLPPGRELYVNASTMIEIEAMVPIEDFTSGRIFQSSTPDVCIAAGLPPAMAKSKTFQPVTSSKLKAPEKASTVNKLAALKAPPGSLMLLTPDDTLHSLEPGLARHLRPHQEAGVRFMYKHILEGRGCILADSMGLGKSLQALALLWASMSCPMSKPLCKKACVVCPSSLCRNWEAECLKWLGSHRVRPTVVQGGGTAVGTQRIIRDFVGSGRLLIISYEQLRTHADIIDNVVDLLVCDEGHRLKSSSAATTKRLSAMHCKRRVLLTGTPLQNNLDEFWCCMSFVQPSLLPALTTFQRVFKKPIDRSQDVSASNQEVELGKARSLELVRLASGVVLRRGPELLATLLPPRYEFLLTAALTLPQVMAYRALCRITRAHGTEARGIHLGIISLLRQLCNVEAEDLRRLCSAPAPTFERVLQQEDADQLADYDAGRDNESDGKTTMSAEMRALCMQALTSITTSDWSSLDCGHPGGVGSSSKMRLLECLLSHLKENYPDDAIVIVSGFMQSLDKCEQLCRAMDIPTRKLTGSTAAQARLELVNSFNKDTGFRILLLSLKAGGVGLNVVGANRLIMLEPDWNPALDLQAMGRIWRQGQAKSCYIYRFAAHGTLEDKIMRRQLRKQDLASVTLDDSVATSTVPSSGSDMAELRQLFELEGYTEAGAPAADRCLQCAAAVPEATGMASGSPVLKALQSCKLLSTTAPPQHAQLVAGLPTPTVASP